MTLAIHEAHILKSSSDVFAYRCVKSLIALQGLTTFDVYLKRSRIKSQRKRKIKKNTSDRIEKCKAI